MEGGLSLVKLFGLGLGGVGIFDPWAVVLFFFEKGTQVFFVQ